MMACKKMAEWLEHGENLGLKTTYVSLAKLLSRRSRYSSGDMLSISRSWARLSRRHLVSSMTLWSKLLGRVMDSVSGVVLQARQYSKKTACAACRLGFVTTSFGAGAVSGAE